jgi:hypothetical protein
MKDLMKLCLNISCLKISGGKRGSLGASLMRYVDVIASPCQHNASQITVEPEFRVRQV